MECEFPMKSADDAQLRSILERVKTIAVMGLSPDESKDSNRVARYLQAQGYKIIPVYPKDDEEILGEKVYTSLADVPDVVDMVNIFRKPAALGPIVDACILRGDVKVFWSQKGIVNNAAAQKAENAGMEVVQNYCSMVEHRKLLG